MVGRASVSIYRRNRALRYRGQSSGVRGEGNKKGMGYPVFSYSHDNNLTDTAHHCHSHKDIRWRTGALQAGKMHKEAGEKYLAENAKKDGIVTLPSGLQYQVLKEGNGKKPSAKDSVKCHYEGFLIDGTVFDSSVQRGEPAVFGLQQVIAGWTEGLQLMQEGAKYRFFIPYRLAYGEGGAGASIPPYAALIFDVELIQVM